MEQRPAESAGVHLPCVSVQRVSEKRVLNVFMHVCSAAAAASCFFPHDRERVRELHV